MAVDDVDLVLAARSGDRAAWAGIYDRYADRLHDFCWSVLRDRDEAADAMHDTFITAYKKLDQLRDPTRLRSWLFAVARTEALAHARKRRRAVPTEEIEMMATGGGPDATAETEDLRRLVWAAAAGLADRDRAALDLHLRQGLEGAALGEALGTSADNANVLMSRLRDQVERSLGAFLVAKRGREDCAALDALLKSWDGEFNPLWRKRIARHVDDCPTCDEKRRAMVSPLALLAGIPMLGAPRDLRDRVLRDLDLISTSRPLAQERRRKRLANAAIAAAIALLLAALLLRNDDSTTGPTQLATATTIAADGFLPPPTIAGNDETTSTSAATTGTTRKGAAAPATTTTVKGATTNTTLAPATTTTTVPLSVSATAGRPSPTCGTPAQVPVTATVRGGRPPYSVTAPWTGPATSGSAGLNQSAGAWRGSMTFAAPGQYTWRVRVRDADGATSETSPRTITINPCPQ
jgi:RNA polymerase sigma factor (sigma-70 family)